MTTKVLVTGGSGFLGRQLVRALMKRGYDVVNVDLNRPLMGQNREIWIPGSIRDAPVVLKEWMTGVDYVFHLAGVSNTGKAAADPHLAMDINITGTSNVLRAASLADVRRVFIASSSLVSEEYSEAGAEDVTLWSEGKLHPYVASKLGAELVARCSDVPVTIMRYGILYGPGMTPGVLVHEFITRALKGLPIYVDGDGKQWRQYMYVGDMVSAHMRLLAARLTHTPLTLHLTPPWVTRVREIAGAIASQIPGTRIEFREERPNDIHPMYCKPDKAQRLLGWKAETPLEQGIRITIDWYRRRNDDLHVQTDIDVAGGADARPTA